MAVLFFCCFSTGIWPLTGQPPSSGGAWPGGRVEQEVGIHRLRTRRGRSRACRVVPLPTLGGLRQPPVTVSPFRAMVRAPADDTLTLTSVSEGL